MDETAGGNQAIITGFHDKVPCMSKVVSPIAAIKEQKRTIIARHVRPDNLKGGVAVAATLVPLGLIWYAVWLAAGVSYWLVAACVGLMSLFLLRVFVLMHDCGHGSLFRNAALNRAWGFAFGVISGMPQYVWSQHHQYHHATNGNWAQYRGPLNIVTVDEYAAMNSSRQRRYRIARNIWLAPFAGFAYLILNPRFTWLRGTAGLIRHIIQGKLTQPDVSMRAHASAYATPYWSSAREYWHMFWNNVALIALWTMMAAVVGPLLFLVSQIVSLSLAGGAGIVLFTVQHNFEHAYASADEGWDYDTAAIAGTSFLVLPPWLNWFTANIGYHHVHHLSARIPSYCLTGCHDEYRSLFGSVARVTLREVPRALRYILWDTRARRIISIAEHQAGLRAMSEGA